MSLLDIINTEIIRRRQSTESLIDSEADMLATVEQFNKLDEMYRTYESLSRNKLENIYKENRHFTGKQPSVYSFTQTEKYPFYGGPSDSDCNPYFPITKVQDNTFDGISPLFAPPTRTGAFQRDANYSATENVPRAPALVQLLAFPDISAEPLPLNWPAAQGFQCTGETPPGSGIDMTTCLLNGGTWGLIPDPVWVGANTAPAKLRVPLQAWKADIQVIQADLFNNPGSTEYNYWQNIVNDIDVVLAAISLDAVFIRATGNTDPAAWGQTQDFIPSSIQDIARDNLIIAAQTGIVSHVATRSSFLNTTATSEEQVFFGIIKLRLHQANGSYAKLKAAKSQVSVSKSLIQDNTDAIASLNLIKVQNS